MLNNHLAAAMKGIRFIDSQYNEKFRVEDGAKVRLITAAPKHSNPNLLPIGETFGFVVYLRKSE